MEYKYKFKDDVLSKIYHYVSGFFRDVDRDEIENIINEWEMGVELDSSPSLLQSVVYEVCDGCKRTLEDENNGKPSNNSGEE